MGNLGAPWARHQPALERAAGPDAVEPPHRPNAGGTPRPPKTTERRSALDAAAKVLALAKVPMRAADMIKQMEIHKLWTSPGGKTPQATLYAAIIREIAAKGKHARFKKHDRG